MVDQPQSQQPLGASHIEWHDMQAASAIGELRSDIRHMSERQDKMDKKLDTVVALSNQWKGVAIVLTFLGAFIGWASGIWSHLKF